MRSRKSVIIAIVGGSGAGKSTFIRELASRMGGGNVCILHCDDYYIDLSILAPAERDQRNFDHPDALDWALLESHLKELKASAVIPCPQYDFKSHTRKIPRPLEPRPFVILDGILPLERKSVRELLDYSIYIDADDDIRFIRRLKRDMQERGRTVDGIVSQYLDSVRPMHRQFVEPTKNSADMVIEWNVRDDAVIDRLADDLLKQFPV